MKKFRPQHLLLVLALIGSGCRWQSDHPHIVTGQAGPDASYRTLLDVLADQKYQVVEQSEAQRTVRVRAHVNESSPSEASFIIADVDTSGTVRLVPSGYLVHDDGKVHARLLSETDDLRRKIERKMGAAVAVAPTASSSARAFVPQASATLPRGFYQPAPPGHGEGELTCLPVHLVDSGDLRLRLSNGEESDVVIALDNSPGICTSECRAPDGCPALGVGDREKVERLAARLAKGQIDWEAQIVAKGSPIAVIDLSRHRFIKQALAHARSGK